MRRIIPLFSLVLGATALTMCTGPAARSGSSAQSTSAAETGIDPVRIPPACADDATCDTFTPTGDIFPKSTYQSDGLSIPDTNTPPPPLTQRIVRLDQDGGYLRPVIPAWRTSVDGRVAIVAGAVRTVRLEALTKPISQEDAGLATWLFGPTAKAVPIEDAGTLDGNFLCESANQNPRPCPDAPGEDCYQLNLISRFSEPDDPKNSIRLRSIPLLVRVKNPKTKDADIDSVVPDGGVTITPIIPDVSSTGEMLSTYDGKLVVLRLHGNGNGGAKISYRLDDGSTATNSVSLAYAYSDTPCDIDAWTATDDAGTFLSMRPIPAAPFDSRLRTNGVPQYGIAARPLRNAAGQVLGERDVLAGSYPWLDREGNNLFFSTVDPEPLLADGGTLQAARFPMSRESGDPLKLVDSAPRGFAVVGAWTQGKTIALDGILNNEDFGFDVDDTHDVGLYDSSNEGLLAVRVNGGSNNGIPQTLKDANADGNNHEIESLENNILMHTALRPVTPRDVVWTVTRGLASDEVAFDDFLNPNLVLLAQMNASWVQEEDPVTGQMLDAHSGRLLDGFTEDGGSFVFDPGAIRLQNSAASPIFPLADAGTVIGRARVEPVALGGVRGRGIWLNENAQMQFAFPEAMTAAAQDKGFYVGMFLDSRDDMVGEHHLFSLVVGGGVLSVLLEDGAVMRLKHFSNGQQDVQDVDISQQLDTWDHQWHHLGVLFRRGGKCTVFVDGNAVGAATLATPLSLAEGALWVGGHPPTADGQPDDSGVGVRGWYDEVRVELNGAGDPLTGEASVELLCNDAHGTTVAVAPNTKLWSEAQTQTYAQTRAAQLGVPPPADGGLLMCATDYSQDLAIGYGKLPPGTTSLREEIDDEGYPPLSWNNPRPDSTGRSFCQSCHIDASRDPGRWPALTTSALTAGTVPTEDDPRTQPMQPPSLGQDAQGQDLPALARGNIPAGWIDDQGQALPTESEIGPVPILQWVLPYEPPTGIQPGGSP